MHLRHESSILAGWSFIFISAQLFLFLPTIIYVTNKEFTELTLTSILQHGSIFSVSVFLLLMIMYSIMRILKLHNGFVLLIVAVSLSSWVISTFLTGQYGELDGRGLLIEQSSVIAITQLSFTLIITLLVISLRHNLKTLINIVRLCFLIAALSAVFQLISAIERTDEPNTKPTAERISKPAPMLSNKKNIIHLVLDEYQSDFFLHNLKNDPSIKEELNGFTFYPNTTANFPTTVMALPAMISGEVYTNEIPWRSFLQQLQKHELTLPQQLNKHGYISKGILINCRVYSVFRNCYKPRQYAANKLELPDVNYIALADIALFRMAPDRFKNYVFNNERWFFQQLLKKNQYDKAGGVGAAFKELTTYVELLNVSNKQPPTYTFIHSLATHSPIWLDEECNVYEKPQQSTLEKRADTGICIWSKVRKIIQFLKDKDLYDKTMLIISSDHGSDFKVASFKANTKTEQFPYAKAAATLLIKPFGNTDKFKISNTPAMLSDIPATVMSQLNTSNIFKGENLLADRIPANRERIFNNYRWSAQYQKWSKEYLPPMQSFAINGNIRDASSWRFHAPLNNEKPISCNKLTHFGSKASAKNFDSYSLGVKESWGRWTLGKYARFSFKFETAQCSPKQLNIVFSAFLSSAHPQQSIKVFLNGELLSTVDFSRGESLPKNVAMRLPQNLLAEKNHVEIYISNPKSPRDLGHSNDARQLGVGLRSLTIQG